MYSGQIQSIGPRYCPSIEDKIVKFPDKEMHQLYLEPEGLNHTRLRQRHEHFPSGGVQMAILKSIPGLESAGDVAPRLRHRVRLD